MPSLQISKDESVFESLVTVEYLDDVYPQRPLLPKDPLLKAKDKIIIEAFGGVSILRIVLIVAILCAKVSLVRFIGDYGNGNSKKYVLK